MKKYYCLGIKGTGMSSLAQILSDLGNDVIGYDDAKSFKFTQKGLDDRNIKIYYDNSHDIDMETIVTYSVALKEDHPEIVRVKQLGLKIQKYNEIMAEVIDLFKSIGVSGTHGKTTTSSIIKHVLENTIGCNYFVGSGSGKAIKENEHFVVESDEFNKHFSIYKPLYSVITNIEEEHMECYKDLSDIKDTFLKFANQTKELVVACGDNENVRSLNIETKTLYYGLNDNNDYVIKNIIVNDSFTSFDLYDKNVLIDSFFVPLFGNHMVLNSTAAIIMLIKIGISLEEIKKYLKTFENAPRRFVETKHDNNIIIDDYAHHPTEIKVTLQAARLKYPNKKLIAVFKPNTYSRTKDFLEDFINVFKLADKSYLTLVESNREKQDDYLGINSNLITEKVDNAEIISVDTIDKLYEYENSVICFMSCAYIDDLINAYKEKDKVTTI